MLVYHGTKIKPDAVQKQGYIGPLPLIAAQKAVNNEFGWTNNKKRKEQFFKQTLLHVGDKKQQNNVVWVTRDHIDAMKWAYQGSCFWNLLRLEAFGLIDQPFSYPPHMGYVYRIQIPTKLWSSAVEFSIPRIESSWIVDIDEVTQHESAYC